LIPDCATALKTHIFFKKKLWHVLCVTTFTKDQLYQLYNIASSFANHPIFPRISLTLLQLPRNQGDPGILNPIIQQQALQ
jgi:hypothetical protein